MKSQLAIIGSLLLSLPVGASELEQLRESNRLQAAKIRALELEIRQLKGGAEAPASSSTTPHVQAPSTSNNTYTVRSGDTLSSIAKSQSTTVKALLTANPGIKPNRLRLGQTVQLPKAAVPEPKSSTPPQAPSTNLPPPASVPVAPAAAPVAVPSDSAPTPGRSGIVRVMIDNVTTAGEFVTRHQTSIQRLNELNGLDLTEASVLAKGSELLCPAQ